MNFVTKLSSSVLLNEKLLSYWNRTEVADTAYMTGTQEGSKVL